MTRMRKIARGTAVIAVALCLSSCGEPKDPARSAETAQTGWLKYLEKSPSVKTVRPWETPPALQDAIPSGHIVETRHYEIHTTVEDALLLGQTALLLESAYKGYTQPLGEMTLEKKLKVVYLATRQQWEAFTRMLAGSDASIYLQIKSGAYCLQGTCVAYHIDRDTDFAVLAHEGWHQFCQQAFAYRLPAWLDEGMATNFESFELNHAQVRFTPGHNGGRLSALRDALADGRMYRLNVLLRMDPGMAMTAGTPNSQATAPEVSAYYAQVYALLRFLRDYDYGRYYQNLERLLSDAAQGAWPLTEEQKAEASQREQNPSRYWNGHVGPLLFDTYITEDRNALEKAYWGFCQEIILAIRPR